MEPSDEIVYRAENGRYRWWPALELVDYTPKGKQRTAETLFLTGKKLSREDAIEIAAKHSRKTLKDKK